MRTKGNKLIKVIARLYYFAAIKHNSKCVPIRNMFYNIIVGFSLKQYQVFMNELEKIKEEKENE